MSISPLKSILKKENYPIKEVQGLEIKAETKKTNESFQRRLSNSFRRSFRKSLYKENPDVSAFNPNLEIKAETKKTNESFQRRLSNSFRRSFRKSLYKERLDENMSFDLSPSTSTSASISIVKKVQKKVTFKLDKDYLYMKPVLSTWEELPKTWEERIQQWMKEAEEAKFKKEQKFRLNHSYYQYMKDSSFEEECQNSEISF